MKFSSIGFVLACMTLTNEVLATPTVEVAGRDVDYRSLRAAVRMRDIEARASKKADVKAASSTATATSTNAAIAGAGSKDASVTVLSANALQTGSDQDGQAGTSVEAGQVPSATDPANFINFCAGQLLTNGLQQKGGSCNGVVMGKIPSTSNMISSILINPEPGQIVKASSTFNVTVQLQGLEAGHFTNAQTTYYSAPQDLSSSGQIIGHTHVTIQDMGKSLTPTKPLDPTAFVFFKGINDAGNGNGLLSAVVTGGLPAGNYRVCTMSSASNHQPVLMPVAQRGAQDDCTKFKVSADGGSSGSAINAASTNQSSTDVALQSSSTAIAAQATTVASSVASSVATASAQSNSTVSASQAPSVLVKSGALGGTAPPVVSTGDATRPFSVNGSTFTTAANAVARSCDIQFNTCANAANSGKLSGKTVGDCSAQKSACSQG